MQGYILGNLVRWTGKIQGTQHMICIKKTKIFFAAQEQKLGATGHQRLLEHSPAT